MKIKPVVIAVGLFTALSAMANFVYADESTIKTHTIGCVQHNEDGCSLFVVAVDKKYPKNCTIVDIMYEFINVDGSDVKAACTQKRYPKKKQKDSIGDRDVVECIYDGMKITVDSVVKSLGKESSSSISTITIEENGKKQVIKGKRLGGC